VPCAGGAKITKLSGLLSMSAPLSVTGTGVSSSVASDWPAADGGSLTPLTVM
jgi:hypothetical protein